MGQAGQGSRAGQGYTGVHWYSTLWLDCCSRFHTTPCLCTTSTLRCCCFTFVLFILCFLINLRGIDLPRKKSALRKRTPDSWTPTLLTAGYLGTDYLREAELILFTSGGLVATVGFEVWWWWLWGAPERRWTEILCLMKQPFQQLRQVCWMFLFFYFFITAQLAYFIFSDFYGQILPLVMSRTETPALKFQLEPFKSVVTRSSVVDVVKGGFW